MTEFREEIYDRYATAIQDRGEHFDLAAARRWGRAYAHFLRGWFPDSKTAAIADLGCGNGQLLQLLKDNGYHNLRGIDVSASQVKLARQVVPDVDLGDALGFLRASESEFDLILSLDVIEHLTKDEALEFLKLSFAALRPGGRLVLQTPNLDSPMSGAVRYGDFTHEIGFTPACLGSLLRLVGYTEIAPREMGPIALGYSLASSVRNLAWQAARLGVRLFNTIETGAAGGGIYTRVFMIAARKP